jgi:putative AdoMet-dependent methyltransferase
MNQPAWWYDELRLAGVDYADPAQAAVYDQRHERFRNYRVEAEEIIRLLELRPDDIVLDMGTGTGAFALQAAGRCKAVHAVDVSPAMLDRCRLKARERNIENIVFHAGGFLTYDHTAGLLDAAVSSAALHHLPDFWKFAGLIRLRRMLKPGGRFYLFDVVFPGSEADLRKPISEWIDVLKSNVGEEFAREAETHLRDEFSTYDWIMEGLLERAGFHLERADYRPGFNAAYLCTAGG